MAQPLVYQLKSNVPFLLSQVPKWAIHFLHVNLKNSRWCPMLNLKNNYVVPYILFIQLSMSLYPGHIFIFRKSHRYRIRDKSRNTSEKQWWTRGGERRITSHPIPTQGPIRRQCSKGRGWRQGLWFFGERQFARRMFLFLSLM